MKKKSLVSKDWMKGYRVGVEEARVCGSCNDREVADLTNACQRAIDKMWGKKIDYIHNVTYKEVNDFKRLLIQTIDECIER